MSDVPTTFGASCFHCKRSMPLRLDGNVRIHGPFNDRCRGSGQPPDQPEASFQADLTNNHSPSSASQNTSTASTSEPDSRYSFSPGRFSGRVLKRIPKASRVCTAKKLKELLSAITDANDKPSWERLLLFPSRCLIAPKRGGHRRNLASIVNQAKMKRMPLSLLFYKVSHVTLSPSSRKITCLSVFQPNPRKVTTGGAVRVASSSESICHPDPRSRHQIKTKHPPSHASSFFPLAPAAVGHLEISPSSVWKAVLSFPAGSAGGPNGLLPQHIKDLLSPAIGIAFRLCLIVLFFQPLQL